MLDLIERLPASLEKYIPLLVVMAFFGLAVLLVEWLLTRRASDKSNARLLKQLSMIALSAIGLVWMILLLPVSEATRGDLLGLLGLVLTGVIAVSSTTFVSNAMAGLMLRSVKSFRHGDFIHAGEHFGRVTERGLFHTEIQTEDRDLVTLPNLYLASSPLTVVRSSGTIISCDLSLGYDVPHHQLEPLFKQAAINAGLKEPFTQVKNLGDFSVSYRVSGYYPEVKHLLSTRSQLRIEILDQLHRAGIEIVSPSFMNQRQFASDEQFIAMPKVKNQPEPKKPAPESLIFDKADKAEKIHALKKEVQTLSGEMKTLEGALQGASDAEQARIASEMERSKARIASLQNIIQKAETTKEK